MLDPTLLVTYVLVVIGLFLVPGPAVLLTLACSISGGRRVGIATGLGIATGDLAHTLMAAIGLSALLATSALAFEIVKYLGVAYLLYLGVVSFFERSASLGIPATRRVDPPRAFRQAVLTEMLNPKTALFFLSFLPQFVRPEPRLAGTLSGPPRILAAARSQAPAKCSNFPAQQRRKA
jgi:threonine/homoserine/homoserine lactone efflux protein